MSASINKVILVGNLGADPDVHQTPRGQSVCNLSVATNEVFKDKTGSRREHTEWHRVVCWGPQGEACARYLCKGRLVYVEGYLRTRSYESKDGQKRYATDIIATHVVFLGGAGEPREQNGRGSTSEAGARRSQHREERHESPPPPTTGERGQPLQGDEDIPF